VTPGLDRSLEVETPVERPPAAMIAITVSDSFTFTFSALP
jgi:hypothetical protein